MIEGVGIAAAEPAILSVFSKLATAEELLETVV